jgi:hypothetical protein
MRSEPTSVQRESTRSASLRVKYPPEIRFSPALVEHRPVRPRFPEATTRAGGLPDLRTSLKTVDGVRRLKLASREGATASPDGGA